MRKRSWRRLVRLRSVRSRSAMLAAVAALLVLGVGAIFTPAVVYKDMTDDAVRRAEVAAQSFAVSLAGAPYVSDPAGLSFVVVWAGGWLHTAGAFSTVSSKEVLLDAANAAMGDAQVRVHLVDFPTDPLSPTGTAPRSMPVVSATTSFLPAARVESLVRRWSNPAPATDDPRVVGQRMVVYVLPALVGAYAVRGALDSVFDVAVPLGVLIAGLAAWLAAGRVARLVERIRSRMAAISVRGLPGRIAVPDSGDEIAALAETANLTIDRLQDALARQRRFVSDASHELRSPVAALRSTLEVALRQPAGADWPAVVRAALAETIRLEELADDLLLLARLDAGTTHAARAVDLGGIVDEQMAERAHARGQSLRYVATTAGPAMVSGSDLEMARLLRNLLDNAARHAETEVAASVRVDDGMVSLSVSDDGPGIRADDRERVFEPFVRIDGSRSRDGGGAGLGLTIVRELAALRGGSAEIADRPSGTCVLVRLPAVGADLVASTHRQRG